MSETEREGESERERMGEEEGRQDGLFTLRVQKQRQLAYTEIECLQKQGGSPWRGERVGRQPEVGIGC